jgi:RNA-binding protein NOB1
MASGAGAPAGGAGAAVEQLVVDSGALIRLETLQLRGASLWTIKEVLSEVRDKAARAALAALPVELRTREPSDASVAAVTAFAKLSGDLAQMSRTDLLVLALTYELHREAHGAAGLRARPPAPGSEAPVEGVADGAAEDEASEGEDDEQCDEQWEGVRVAAEQPQVGQGQGEGEQQSPTISAKASLSKPGVSWAAALAGNKAAPAASAAASAPASAPAAPAAPAAGAAAKSAAAALPASAMWDDDDFAGAGAGGATAAVSASDAESGSESGSESESGSVGSRENGVQEEWPSLAVCATPAAKVEALARERALVTAAATEAAERGRRRVERRQRRLMAIEAERHAAAAAQRAEREKGEGERLAAAQAAAKAQPVRSRLLGFSGVNVDASGIDDGVGWITMDNLAEVDPFEGLGRPAAAAAAEAAAGVTATATAAAAAAAPTPAQADATAEAPAAPATAHAQVAALRSAAAEWRVACVTTDYAMQNVLIQMNLRLLTLEGRSVTHVRRFVLKCDSCLTICRDLAKKFCPACGNATLARLNYSIGPDGVVTYHYRKGRRVNTRGTKYSLPKPRGGRTGDLLLCEDQLLTGWWAQQANKKQSATSMFGEHITESLGVDTRVQGGALRIGYGRQNPNAAKGRERRGKKKTTKKPGHL